MEIRSARFKLLNNWSDQQSVQAQMEDAKIIFQGEGCGYSLEQRIDENHVPVCIYTTPEIMDIVMQDPRLELMQQLEGWPEPELEEEIIDI